MEDRERNDRCSYLTSVASFGDSAGFMATSGGEPVEGTLATAGELAADIASSWDVPVALPIVAPGTKNAENVQLCDKDT